jgi:hypothetical protein
VLWPQAGPGWTGEDSRCLHNAGQQPLWMDWHAADTAIVRRQCSSREHAEKGCTCLALRFSAAVHRVPWEFVLCWPVPLTAVAAACCPAAPSCPCCPCCTLQSTGLVRHVFRLLAQANSEQRPVPWVLLENVSRSGCCKWCCACMLPRRCKTLRCGFHASL